MTAQRVGRDSRHEKKTTEHRAKMLGLRWIAINLERNETMSIEILKAISKATCFPVNTVDGNTVIAMRHVNLTIEIEGNEDDGQHVMLHIVEPITETGITISHVPLDDTEIYGFSDELIAALAAQSATTA